MWFLLLHSKFWTKRKNSQAMLTTNAAPCMSTWKPFPCSWKNIASLPHFIEVLWTHAESLLFSHFIYVRLSFRNDFSTQTFWSNIKKFCKKHQKTKPYHHKLGNIMPYSLNASAARPLIKTPSSAETSNESSKLI